MAGAKNNVLWVESACAAVAARYLNSPSFGCVIVDCGLWGGLGPDVEFHEGGIGFKPVTELVFWRKDWPVGRKWKVCHVGVLDWIVGNECQESVSKMVGHV